MKKMFMALIIIMLMFLVSACGEQEKARMEKDRISESEGLNRTVDVYSYDGQLLRHYEGKFDIDSNTSADGATTGSKIKFDLDGKRHIIYNAIVITDEK